VRRRQSVHHGPLHCWQEGHDLLLAHRKHLHRILSSADQPRRVGIQDALREEVLDELAARYDEVFEYGD
jgi:hypothetical protein